MIIKDSFSKGFYFYLAVFNFDKLITEPKQINS